ncbi:hypothetical protein [Parasulfitobacter algicola]|uniref:Ribbon-helix-helix protein CopG domain-containing protein n=1 Tax=Parasulfitobacter algicola TaxID=2614809 RepID=A0ABX2IMF0_9RHOB|nr:hypothetical protein [Sulfitobacter algicola]NSX54057.1 hypothetical protein [Sulfitobacter algicola]
MDKITAMFHLSQPTIEALQKIAAEEGVEAGDIVRDAIKRDLFRRSRAKKSVRTDERLVAPLRALLADDFAFATGWKDLQARLSVKGYMLQEAGAGLALFEIGNNRRVAKASDFGTSYTKLMRRFNAPFPGHSHIYIFERDIARSAARDR